MRTYYRSFFLWFRWTAWLLILLFVVYTGLQAKKQQGTGLIASGVFSLGILLFLYLILKAEPYAIQIYPDKFVVCFAFGRKEYFFAEVTDIALDVVHYKKSGDVESVRVAFQDGWHLQLQALNNRRKFYEDLHKSWRVATGGFWVDREAGNK